MLFVSSAIYSRMQDNPSSITLSGTISAMLSTLLPESIVVYVNWKFESLILTFASEWSGVLRALLLDAVVCLISSSFISTNSSFFCVCKCSGLKKRYSWCIARAFKYSWIITARTFSLSKNWSMRVSYSINSSVPSWCIETRLIIGTFRS